MLAGTVAPCLNFPISVFAAEEEEINYLTQVYETAEDKLHTMGEPVYTSGDMELYYLAKTGEVAVRNAKTKQILLSNPFNVGASAAAESVKKNLLSQLIIKYRDSAGLETEFDSYSYAAMSDQIIMKNIKGGIRVEYAIGNTQKKKIVPRYITAERFETKIVEVMNEANPDAAVRLLAFYQKKDSEDPTLTPRARAEMLKTYPITEEKPIYVIAPDIKSYELDQCEQRILKYTSYTLEDMLADHEECEYVLEDDSPPLFKMSLEYYLNNDGVSVNLPARGITYDTAKYKLLEVKILPYFGAAYSEDEGYTLVPDGSGAIFEHKNLTNYSTLTGSIYGNDFGFYTVTGGSLQTWKYPIYGIASNRDLTELNITYHEKLDEDGKPELDDDGEVIMEMDREVISVKENVSQGFFAVIEEGESLAKLTAEFGGNVHQFNSAYITVFPRQSDSYPLDGITVSGQTATYEVDCERKYVGNFRTRYIMLFEDNSDYVGMADTYRDYLIETGVFENMNAKDNEDITLYLEAFGDIDTIEKFLGMPVSAKTPLTTFEQAKIMTELLQGVVSCQEAADLVKEMYPADFKDDEPATVDAAQAIIDRYIKVYGGKVDKLALKYTGWFNGGMWNTPPSKLDVDSVIGGDDGLKKLVNYLNEAKIDFYPDFEFSRVNEMGLFDNFDYEKDCAMMVDGKPARFKSYNYIFQTLTRGENMLISSTALSRFYSNFREKFLGFNTNGISAGTLGTDLNSSQHEDEPVNREESKELVMDLLGQFVEDGKKVMVSGGNEYVIKYADVILDAPLDSNGRVTASREIPFVGMVLHGYVEFSGMAINLAGDYDYAVLKTIENGAVPYYILSYDNTSELKESGLTEYYAIQYNIWYDELIKTYNEINGALKKVTGSVIAEHDIIQDRVVKVTYTNGVSFVLNYNNFEVEVESENIKLAAMDFAVL